MSAPVASGDPYYVVRAEVQHSMTKIQGAYVEWTKMIETGDNTMNEQLELKTSALLSTLRSVEWDLQDLDETVRVVQTNPARFNVTPVEANERRAFVTEMQSQTARIRKHVASPEVKNMVSRARRNNTLRHQHQHQRQQQAASSSIEAARESSSVRTAGYGSKEAAAPRDDFVSNEALQQDLIMAEQDVELGELGKSVNRIGDMGKEMHLELSRQGEMLDDIDTEMDATMSRFRAVQQKLNKIIEETSKGQLCTIVMLTVALVILTLLVVLT